jgi:L-fuconolactonase
MFGSDWPVCLVAARYEQVMQALRHATSNLSRAENEAVFGGNALRVYGLTA